MSTGPVIENHPESIFFPPEPAWEVARLFPAQGQWTEDEYLALSGNRLVEFSNGFVEVLSMPTDLHQAIVAFLHFVLSAFVEPKKLGKTRFSPLRVKLWQGKFREPDVLFLFAENDHFRHQAFWEHADLAMEVVSDDDRRRDLETKRFEYARAGINEYWIVDPQQFSITVLKLEGERYVTHSKGHRGEKVSSNVLAGFEVDVTAALTHD